MISAAHVLHVGRPITWAWAGELDLGDVAKLQDTWRSLLERDPRRITIDLAGVTFLDCAVVSFLVGARHHARTRLVLRAVPSAVVDLFRRIAVTGVLTPPSQQPPPPDPSPPAAPAAAVRLQHAA